MEGEGSRISKEGKIENIVMERQREDGVEALMGRGTRDGLSNNKH